jgi:geranyl-CoA carboxylase alpha subunit
MPALKKLLIANRGEIALRIERTARDLGLSTVAVYSDVDANVPHVRAAREAVPIGSPESYMSTEAILEAARTSGADSIHPGYGFLSENADFAQACLDDGLVFVGPDPGTIRLMGDKRRAKSRMTDAGIPCVPGWDGDSDNDDFVTRAAEEVGYPLMVKAAAGGGGRGMRAVTNQGDLLGAIQSARSEASETFGDGTLILEKAIAGARHIEAQVFGDRHGNFVHMGARDCSVQRRHQKIIEEAPPPEFSEAVQSALCAAATRVAAEVDYVGAGTVEFLVGPDDKFYFLEMNTRLQVEHVVTEMITGEDLVAWQLCVAVGDPLPKLQSDICFSGHAIEARLYAEDTEANFLPQTGPVLLWRSPERDNVRVECGIETGSVVTSYYDPMAAKVIAHGADRMEATALLSDALTESVLLGVATNKHFLIRVLADADFRDGAMKTDTVDQCNVGWVDDDDGERALGFVLAALLHFDHSCDEVADFWWNTGPASHLLIIGEGAERRKSTVLVDPKEESFSVQAPMGLVALDRSELEPRLRVDGAKRRFYSSWSDEGILWLDLGTGARAYEDLSYIPATPLVHGSSGLVTAPITGRILRILVCEGDEVGPEDTLLTIEAMKIEHKVVAPIAGTVIQVVTVAGEQVASRSMLVEIAPDKTGNLGK